MWHEHMLKHDAGVTQVVCREHVFKHNASVTQVVCHEHVFKHDATVSQEPPAGCSFILLAWKFFSPMLCCFGALCELQADILSRQQNHIHEQHLYAAGLINILTKISL